LLGTSDKFRDLTFIEGFLERQTDLGDNGRPSQTDLLVLAKSYDGLCVIGVEGKAEEPFGEIVQEWLGEGSPTRTKRLSILCEMLGLHTAPLNLRYQLFHRSAACVIEAKHFGARSAMLLVHSFSKRQRSLSDYRAFVSALGADATSLPDKIVGPVGRQVAGGAIELYFGWVTDDVDHAEFWNELRQHGEDASSYSKSIADWIAQRGY
jgi:hypothetical protein